MSSSDWSTVGKPQQVSRNITFPEAAAVAFGKKKPVVKTMFSDTAATAFSRPVASSGAQHTNGFSEGASAAFGNHKTNGSFSDNASSAFNGGDTRTGGFGEQAASAFGKKRPSKSSAPSTSSPLVTRRNDSFGALLAAAMPTLDTAVTNDYSKSALRYTKPDASPKIMKEEMFPSLSPQASTSAASPKTSFADVIRKRAQDDLAEAQKQKEAQEAERQRIERDRLNRPTVHSVAFIGRNTIASRNIEEDDEAPPDIHDLDYVPPYGREKTKSRVYDDQCEEEHDDDIPYDDAE